MIQKSAITSIYFLFSLTLYGQYDTPKALTIFEHFFNTYKKNIPDSTYIGFEKRNNDWIVRLSKYDSNKLDDGTSYLFYDSKQKRYNFIPLKTIRSDEVLYSLNNYIEESAFFDLLPSYGYEGWYKDVVMKFDSVSHANLYEQYALGIAYSKWADALISYKNVSNDSFRINANCWQSLNCLSPSQIDTFIFIKSKALNCFNSISKLDSNFKIWGRFIGEKYANEFMDLYYKLMIYSYDYWIKTPIPDISFSRDVLDKSNKWLIECPKNSILLVIGDEFYSLFYLQQKFNVRRDVMVICSGELALNNYLKLVTSNLSTAYPIKISVNIESYPIYTHLNNNGQPFDFSKLPKFLNEKNKSSLEYPYPTLNAGQLLIHKTGLSQDIRIDLDGNHGILKSDLILLDIINNLGNRKMCSNDFEHFTFLRNLRYHSEAQENIWIYNP